MPPQPREFWHAKSSQSRHAALHFGQEWVGRWDVTKPAMDGQKAGTHGRFMSESDPTEFAGFLYTCEPLLALNQ